MTINGRFGSGSRALFFILTMGAAAGLPAIDAAAQTLVAAPAAPAQSAPAASELLKAEELEQILAPIALYSDALLSNVLMAATYPLEVVEADRWAKANKNLKGEALKTNVAKQRWDDSVKQLVAVPSVLDMMSSKLEWTQKLGDAMLAQQADVMDAVQRLRARADAQNNLKTTSQQKVTKQTQEGKQVIVIEPAQPDTVYVPYYNSSTIYGTWPYAEYPPYYYPQPYWYPGTLAAGAIGFGLGAAVGAAWGGGFGWGNNNVYVDHRNINNVNNRFNHRVEHRGGVRYNNRDVAQKFGRGDRGGANQRMDFRGRDGNQVLGDRGNRGDRGNLGDRNRPTQNAGDRGGNRQNAGNRGGNRQNAGNRGGGNRAGAGNRGGNRAAQRPAGGRGGGLGNVAQGRGAMASANRGRASMAGGFGGGGRFAGAGGGGGFRGGGGGGFRGGGGGGFRGGGGGRGGGGRRSDMALKHDVVLLGTLDNGLGFYRFAYHESDKTYVGVMAQEVQQVMPSAVLRGSDGYLRVRYDRIGVKFQTYDVWLASGAKLPAAAAAK